MVATRLDHVAGWAVWWASDHSPNKIYLSSHNHVSYAGDGVKHVVHFAIAQMLFLYFCHQDLDKKVIHKQDIVLCDGKTIKAEMLTDQLRHSDVHKSPT
jgi:hypothetical protein